MLWEFVQHVSIICPTCGHWKKVEDHSGKEFTCLVTIYNRELFSVLQSVFANVTSLIPPNNPALFTQGYNPQGSPERLRDSPKPHS